MFRMILASGMPNSSLSLPSSMRFSMFGSSVRGGVRGVPKVDLSPTFATRGIEAAKLEVFRGVRSKGRHHTGRCHGAATSTEAILGDG
jgi:hypothetical protein